MSNLFNSVKLQRPKTNLFDLSHERKLSLNMGELVPILCQPVVPGDKFKVNTEMLLRLAPTISPMMHRVNAYVHYFFVPNRLVWANWEKFITGGVDGADASVMPTIPLNDSYKGYFGKGYLSDYLGVPVPPSGTITDAVNINALPFRAYVKIYNEYYRDPNLETALDIKTTDAVTSIEHGILASVRKRCWEKDYFTSALPWTQRGGEVLIPGTNVVTYKNIALTTGAGASSATALTNDASSQVNTTGGVVGIDNIDTVELSASINDLRRSARLQAWLERNALGGSRYIEQIFAHFGVKSDDARLQRPEYLGGGKTPITISEVLNTSSTATEPQGNMAGHGIGVGNTNRFSKYFKEHGYVMGILSVLPRTAYQQGIPRDFLKYDKFDYYFPEFANIGEQDVKNGEVYYKPTATAGTALDTWAYQSRYAEYKYNPSSVHGDFKDNLSFWHMGRIFTDLPPLNTSFVQADPTHRVFAVTTTTIDKVYVQLYNDIKAIRPMPKFGTPGIHIV